MHNYFIALIDINPSYSVIASKCEDYAIGDLVVNSGGWCTHIIANSSTKGLAKLHSSVPPEKSSTGLGVFGMPGYV